MLKLKIKQKIAFLLLGASLLIDIFELFGYLTDYRIVTWALIWAALILFFLSEWEDCCKLRLDCIKIMDDKAKMLRMIHDIENTFINEDDDKTYKAYEVAKIIDDAVVKYYEEVENAYSSDEKRDIRWYKKWGKK